MKLKIIADRDIEIISNDNEKIKMSTRLMTRKAFDLRNSILDNSITDQKVIEFLNLVISECLKIQENEQEIILKVQLDNEKESPTEIIKRLSKA